MVCPQLFFGEIFPIRRQQKRFNLRQNLDFTIPPMDLYIKLIRRTLFSKKFKIYIIN